MTMKKIYLTTILLVSFLTAFSQTIVPKFLGIPIDGTKNHMIQQIINKGYVYNAQQGYLTGEFNGDEVNIHIVTHNNKVWRIMIEPIYYTSERDVKIKFNELCNQFYKNPRYIPSRLKSDYALSDSENISYEINSHNKQYSASYIQIPQLKDSSYCSKGIIQYIVKHYETPDLLWVSCILLNEYKDYNDVWFMIDEFDGTYGILLYYDNLQNEANGEDL